MFFKHEDDTLKYLNAEKLQSKQEEKKLASGSFTSKAKTQNNNIKYITIIASLIILFMIFPSKQKEINPLIGTWEPINKPQYYTIYTFNETTMYSNNHPTKVKYEVKENQVIVKPAIYGLITGMVPPSKFNILNQEIMEQDFAAIKIMYKKIQ